MGRVEKDKRRKGSIISNALGRCRFLGSSSQRGCFSVYVGPERERFEVRTELANHTLFRHLLDEAETEYGFHKAGPLELPCDVGLFRRLLAEMSREDIWLPRCGGLPGSPLRGFGSRRAGYKLVNPA